MRFMATAKFCFTGFSSYKSSDKFSLWLITNMEYG